MIQDVNMQGVEIFFPQNMDIEACKYRLRKRGLVWASWEWKDWDGVLESVSCKEDTHIWFLDFCHRYVFKFVNNYDPLDLQPTP